MFSTLIEPLIRAASRATLKQAGVLVGADIRGNCFCQLRKSFENRDAHQMSIGLCTISLESGVEFWSLDLF